MTVALSIFLDGAWVQLFSESIGASGTGGITGAYNVGFDYGLVTGLRWVSDNPQSQTFHNMGGTNYEFSSAVPEPGSLALLGLGLAGIGFSRRKAIKA